MLARLPFLDVLNCAPFFVV
jgi:hypothetical protein